MDKVSEGEGREEPVLNSAFMAGQKKEERNSRGRGQMREQTSLSNGGNERQIIQSNLQPQRRVGLPIE